MGIGLIQEILESGILQHVDLVGAMIDQILRTAGDLAADQHRRQRLFELIGQLPADPKQLIRRRKKLSTPLFGEDPNAFKL